VDLAHKDKDFLVALVLDITVKAKTAITAVVAVERANLVGALKTTATKDYYAMAAPELPTIF
jgi:hypothetical protein